jgi:hypothetical protein
VDVVASIILVAVSTAIFTNRVGHVA